MYSHLRDVLALLPGVVVLPTDGGDVDSTYDALISALDTGATETTAT
jgi:hypothetical protein